MVRRYTDPETGFEILTNDDEAHVGYKPATPQAATEDDSSHEWGDVGQGVRGTSGAEDVTPENLKDFAWWQKNKQRVNEHFKDQTPLNNL